MTTTADHSDSESSPAAAPSSVRYPAAIALGGGVAAAIGSSFIPMNAIEGFVTAYGIAELLPAAAPPLGNTARLALSTGIGTLTAGALLALLPRGETDDMGFESAVKKRAAAPDASEPGAHGASGFGATKFAGWLRTLRFGKAEAAEGEVTDFADVARLRMRNGDHHPDAPARAPILASSDLGAPLDAPAERVPEIAMPTAAQDDQAAPFDLDASMAVSPPAEPIEQPRVMPTMRFAPPPAIDVADEEPRPIGDDSVQAIPSESAETLTEALAEAVDIETIATTDVGTAPHEAAAPAEPAADLQQLSIGSLLERLETGLARRRDLAAGRKAAATDQPMVTGQVIPLGKPTGVMAEESLAPMPQNDPAPSLRFRLGQPPLPKESPEAASVNEDAMPVLPVRDQSWDSEVEYHPPIITPNEGQDLQTEATPPNGREDDDMDAALRDALATLRQLSDRQRNL